ncbi:Exodeoxyribonuclease VII large subunit [Nitrosospira sp. Nsp11]|uniref:exodeoxyribonuclease VII large subunit n=1 Tax=Nitrosospira sp. Nsp11 TaxID=1855338 RepID=UPI00092233FA|nr:exodeoxyribonuclease VII large subunit [Nitrosospira sp. Nsp11]SHL61704.1 Exodeoxyribonuclease VII large subunit [Nitrosospira sp. Nsp11]
MNFIMEMEIARPVLSVSELNRSAKDLLEQAFPLLWVGGEISNIKRYGSGHWYFSLKDADAQIRCVMFRDKNQYLDWQPSDGMRVEVRALVTLYQSRGDFQLNVETIRRAGLGSLFEAFERLKARLGKEGLFDADRKKPLPLFPRQIGIITSPAAAALHDVLSTLKRRMSFVPLIIYGTPVQGAGASAKIAAAIRNAGNRAECDVLILCRGGGSIEDLWAFNEEAVARAIAACPIPIVSGVGHETDFTIADFVADVRAPTPTGASQLVCPDRKELIRHGEIMHGRLQRAMQRGIESRMQHIDMLECRLVHPGKRINDQLGHLQHLRERLARSWHQDLARHYWRLRELDQRLLIASPDIPRLVERQRDLGLRMRRAIAVRIETLVMSLQRQQENLAHLNPESVLERGYSIVYGPGGAVVRSSDEIDVGDTIRVEFAKGGSKARVTEKNE